MLTSMASGLDAVFVSGRALSIAALLVVDGGEEARCIAAALAVIAVSAPLFARRSPRPQPSDDASTAQYVIHAVAPDSEFGYEGLYTGALGRSCNFYFCNL